MTPLVLTDAQNAPEGFLDEWPEDSRFYRATQHALPGFALGYLIATRAATREAVVPYFTTEFKLNTMLDDGWLSTLLAGMSLRIACVGHPTAAFGRIEGQVTEELTGKVFEALSKKAPLVAFKGFGHDLAARGFVRVAGLPVAVLRMQGDFWGTLHTHKRRNDLTRKLKAGSALRFEEHDGLPAHYLGQVHRLYLNIYERAPIRFERLSPEYFSATSAQSIYLLAFLGERLVGFAQLLPKGERVVGKYMGMDYAVSRTHRLYFLLYLQALELCARRGFSEIEFGEASYSFKKTLGCDLAPTWIYYRHRNPVLHRLLARLAFLMTPDVGV